LREPPDKERGKINEAVWQSHLIRDHSRRRKRWPDPYPSHPSLPETSPHAPRVVVPLVSSHTTDPREEKHVVAATMEEPHPVDIINNNAISNATSAISGPTSSTRRKIIATILGRL
jgi:hypothetical protein